MAQTVNKSGTMSYVWLLVFTITVNNLQSAVSVRKTQRLDMERMFTGGYRALLTNHA